MPTPIEFSVNTIMNRVFRVSTNSITINSSGGAGGFTGERSIQAVFNLAFDATNNVLNFS